MNNVHLSPDPLVLNPNPAVGLRKNKNINLSIGIEQWNNFDDTNNQIPTMDASPMYANYCPTKGELFSHNSPDYRTRKRNQTNNIDHIEHIDHIENSYIIVLLRWCEYIFSWWT